MTSFSSRTAIAGYGATEFSKNSGRSELRLAVEATLAALADAGIDATEVDGISTYMMDNNGEQEVFRAIGGKDLTFFSRISQGGGATCAPLQQAAMAITCGIANVVVVYRAMNERSEYRFGQPMHALPPTSDNVVFAYHGMSGLMTPAAMMGMMMRRYMQDSGATSRDFANYAVLARKHAATNPKAFFYGKPITVDDHQASKLIADPLHLLDCCQESDGAVAVVVVGAERARDLRQRPVYIRAAAQGSPAGALGLSGFYRDNIAPYDECAAAGRQLYAQSGLTPNDIDAAILYDHFGPSVFPGLEAYGFCAKGEAKEFIKDGHLEIGGRLPLNMHGGQLGEAYIHGMNGVAEAVRQLRGTAVNQVPGVKTMLVTAGSGVPTSAAILGID
jgi:acetyl-CoA acetyltransferase